MRINAANVFVFPYICMLIMLVSLRDGLVRTKHLTVFLSLSCCFQHVGRVTFDSGNARKIPESLLYYETEDFIFSLVGLNSRFLILAIGLFRC